jgi:MFS family permease
VAISSFVARIPDVQARLELREAALGVVLAALSAGVITGLIASGRLVPRTGSRAAVAIGGAVAAGALPLVGLAPTPWLLAIALFAAGAGTSTMDVGMNAQGVGVERGYGRSIMVGLHAAWSIGALTGALGGSLAMGAGLPLPVHLSLIAALVAATTFGSLPWLRFADRSSSGVGSRRPFAWPRGPLFPLALVCLAATIGESTAGDWSGIHLRDNLGVAAGRVAWGYVASTAAMVAVRLVGDRIAERFGARRVIRAGGWLAGTGFVIAALAPALPVALLGFAMSGAGLGVIVPLAFAAAGRIGDSPGESVAAVATVGYLAFVVAPPVIGVIADLINLPVAFSLVGVAVILLTGRLPRTSDHSV